MKKVILIAISSILFFASCNPNRCEATNCINGGYCEDGMCSCPPGYSGSNCEKKLVPKSMTIIDVTVNKFPSGNNIGVGSIPWDPTDGPDIYVTINSGQSANHNYITTNPYNNVSAANEYSFAINKTITSLNSDWIIGLWDYDWPNSEYIGGIYFKPADNTSGFSAQIPLYNSSAPNKKFTLTVHWNF